MHTAGRCLLVAAFLLVAPRARADRPLPSPESYLARSENKKFVADVKLEDNITTVYKVEPDGSRSPLWRMYGWFRWAEVSSDGKYVAIPYRGFNLLHEGYRRDEVMLYVVKEGKLLRVVRLNELIRDFSQISPTPSHYRWGWFRGFNDRNEFVIETVEGNRFFIGPDGTSVKKVPPAERPGK